MAIDWSAGYRCEDWRAYLVDTRTWADSGMVAGISSLSVERTIDGEAPLLESGSLVVDRVPGERLVEGYWRIAMLAVQDGETERVDLCTLLVQSSTGTVERGVDALSVDGRSVLWPASVSLMEAGSYAPAGSDAVALAASYLRAAVAAPVEVQGSATIDQHVVFDVGSSALQAAWSLLDACGYTIRISGDGTIRILPTPDTPSLELGQASTRLLHPGVSHSLDWSGVPNRYVAVDGSNVAEAVNDDARSPTSIVARGYRHDVVDTSPVRVDGETLASYARRRLAEESVATDSRTYKREWWPGVRPGDLVRASVADVGLDGDLRVYRQSLECGRGVVVEEEARTEVRSWPTTE